jgi:hypothetical protein
MVPGKGILWFCSSGFSPNPSRSTGANHCLRLLQLLGTHKKAGDQKKKKSHNFKFMDLQVSFQQGLGSNAQQAGH